MLCKFNILKFFKKVKEDFSMHLTSSMIHTFSIEEWKNAKEVIFVKNEGITIFFKSQFTKWMILLSSSLPSVCQQLANNQDTHEIMLIWNQ